MERGGGNTFKLCCVSGNSSHEGECARLLAGDFVGGFLIFFTAFEQSYTDKAKYQNGDIEFTGHTFKFQHIFNGTIQKEEKCIQIIELCVSLLHAVHAETRVIVIFNRPSKVPSSALFQLF